MRIMTRIPKRLVLVNWSLYSHLLMDFDQINFITGNTGSGKSTIADAIQLILFGDTKGGYFNKAGDGNSSRRLIDYLYADKGIESMRRLAPFMSFVLLEFERRDNDGDISYFTLSYMANIDEDDIKTSPNTWFVLEDRIPDKFLDASSIPQSRDDLRKLWLELYGEEYKNKVLELFSNADYMRKIKDPRYLNIKEEYIKALKKAVSFERINKMDSFIADYLCQGVAKPDFNRMKIVYDELAKLSYQVEEKDKKRKLLDKIISSYDEFERCSLILNSADYVASKAKLEILRRTNSELFSKLEKARDKVSELNSRASDIEQKYKDFQERLTDIGLQIAENAEGHRRDRLKNELDALRGDVSRRLEEKDRYLQNFDHLKSRWLDIATESKTLESDYWLKDHDIDALYGFDTLDGREQDFSNLNKIVKAFGRIKKAIAVSTAVAEQKADALKSEIEQIEKKIEKLKSGLGNYPDEVSAFAKFLEEEHGIKSVFLADLLEIESDEWANASESVLASNRYALLVEPQCFKKAANLLRQYRLEKDSIRIFDIEALYKEKPISQKGSLSEVISSKDQSARYAINKLLGSVMMAKESDAYVLKDCLLYKDDVLEKMPESYYKYRMIGKKAKENNIKSYEDAIDEKKASLAEQNKAIMFFYSIENVPILEQTQIENYKDVISRWNGIPELKEKIQSYEEELSSLDLSVIDELLSEKESVLSAINGIQDEQRSLSRDKANADNYLEDLLKSSGDIALEIEQKEARLESDPFKAEGERLYLELSIDQRPEKLCHYDESFEAKDAKGKKEDALVEIKFNQKIYKELSRNTLLDEESIKREIWEKESSLLGPNDLKEYHDRLISKRQEAYKLLMDEVITKMGNAIKGAKASLRRYTNQIKDISFSGFKYEFKAEKRQSPEFAQLYDLFYSSIIRTSVQNGQGDIFFDSWREEHKDAIEHLERLLGLRDRDDRKSYEVEIERYTNYKNYLDFDLIKYPENDPERVLSFNKAGKRGSGGEMQIDTYIPVVTAVYSSSRESVDFIMLDEAFNKVTGEYVKNAIELLRQFGMRSILLAPTGRIEEFSESADKTFIIEKKNIGGKDIAFACPYK